MGSLMTSNKPYLIRALHEWILDNELTPYVLVDTQLSGMQVPEEYIQGNQIVFNLTPGIVTNLVVSNEAIQFEARFAGRLRKVYFPIKAVAAIYAKENGEGTAFEVEIEAPQPPHSEAPSVISETEESSQDNQDEPSKTSQKPQLRIVKGDDDS
jgi:stringent starvation protein B